MIVNKRGYGSLIDAVFHLGMRNGGRSRSCNGTKDINVVGVEDQVQKDGWMDLACQAD
jgi:hypothetical protein